MATTTCIKELVKNRQAQGMVYTIRTQDWHGEKRTGTLDIDVVGCWHLTLDYCRQFLLQVEFMLEVKASTRILVADLQRSVREELAAHPSILLLPDMVQQAIDHWVDQLPVYTKVCHQLEVNGQTTFQTG